MQGPGCSGRREGVLPKGGTRSSGRRRPPHSTPSLLRWSPPLPPDLLLPQQKPSEGPLLANGSPQDMAEPDACAWPRFSLSPTAFQSCLLCVHLHPSFRNVFWLLLGFHPRLSPGLFSLLALPLLYCPSLALPVSLRFHTTAEGQNPELKSQGSVTVRDGASWCLRRELPLPPVGPVPFGEAEVRGEAGLAVRRNRKTHRLPSFTSSQASLSLTVFLQLF